MAKISISITQILLAFAAGWYVHSWFLTSTELDQQVSTGYPTVEYEGMAARENMQLYQTDTNLSGPGVLADLFIRLVENGELEQALIFFNRERVIFSTDQIDQYGDAILDFLKDKEPAEYYRLPALRDLAAVLGQLDRYSPAAQYFEVIRLARNEPLLALARLDELASYYQEQVSEVQLRKLESWLLTEVEVSLLGQQNWQALEAWYEALLARSSDPLEIYDQMARAFAAANRPFESSRALENIKAVADLNSTQLRLQEKNLAVIESSSFAAVQMIKAGQQFIAPVILNGQIPASLLVDTGASISSLDLSFSEQIGLKTSGKKILLGTAGGQVEAELINLQALSLGESLVYDLTIARVDLNGRHQGLLGMDVLGKFEFYIDQQGSILYLRKPRLPEGTFLTP